MSNIEALYLVSGFWLAAIPLTYQIRKLTKQHSATLLDYEHKARLAIEQAKLDTCKKANQKLDYIRRANML